MFFAASHLVVYALVISEYWQPRFFCIKKKKTGLISFEKLNILFFMAMQN